MASIQAQQHGPAPKVHAEPIRILVDSFADRGLANAQMINAREIIRRLDPERFFVSIFHVDEPDSLFLNRPNTSLIHLPARLQTVKIFKEFVLGRHNILFYLKVSPASKWYLRARREWKDSRAVIGTVEAQCDYHNEPMIRAEYVRRWEHTVLRCDYLFSNCSSVQKSLQAEYGRPSEIVPTGVDVNFFKPAWERAPNPRLRVLFVGSLFPFKEPQMLLQAAPRFLNADFVIVGAGVMAQELKERVERERLTNVYLVACLDRDKLRQEFQRADVFLFPSRWEGSPRVILEAAASGLPVIVRNNYQPETVLEGQTGFIVASNDELFARLETLLTQPDVRRSFGEAGRKHAALFDWDLIVRRWEEIFLRVMSERKSGRRS